MAAPSVFFGTSWEDEVAQAPVAPAVTPEPKQHRKSFQYAGHSQPGRDYSPFHKQLDASLKHLYSKTNLAAAIVHCDGIEFLGDTTGGFNLTAHQLAQILQVNRQSARAPAILRPWVEVLDR